MAHSGERGNRLAAHYKRCGFPNTGISATHRENRCRLGLLTSPPGNGVQGTDTDAADTRAAAIAVRNEVPCLWSRSRVCCQHPWNGGRLTSWLASKGKTQTFPSPWHPQPSSLQVMQISFTHAPAQHRITAPWSLCSFWALKSPRSLFRSCLFRNIFITL